MDARLIIDFASAGAWNMAVDETLLDSARHGSPCLRFYEWSEPTVSLGYFQPSAARDAHGPSQSCAWVRRSTGGGAIIHHHELTYSFTCQAAGRHQPDPVELYREIHTALIDELSRWGLAAALCEHDRKDESFVCFTRRAEGDVVAGPHKICGSAQRRVRSAVLLHGSLLLRRSEFAPELPGICELGVERFEMPAFRAQWAARIAARFGLSWHDSRLSESESRMALELVQSRHTHPTWLLRR